MTKRKPNPNTCEFCPHRFDGSPGCPVWVKPENGFLETNQSGEVRTVQGCFYQVIPKLMVHVVQASNRPAAVLQEMRNETAHAMGQIAQAVQEMLPRLQGATPLQVENKSDGKE